MHDKPNLKLSIRGKTVTSSEEKKHIGPTLYSKDRENISKLNEFDVTKSLYVMKEVCDMNIIQDLLESVDLAILISHKPLP